MKKIIVCGAILLLGAGCILQKNKQAEPVVSGQPPASQAPALQNQTALAPETAPAADVKPSSTSADAAPKNISREAAWGALQKFIQAVSAGNMAELDKLSSKPGYAKDCDADCRQMLAAFIKPLSQMQSDDFKIFWSDARQAILQEERVPNKETVIVFFTAGNGGAVQVLGVSNESTITALDSDQDGIVDQQEKCEGASGYDKKCVKTDPTKRDTDGDGWWDGVQKKWDSL